MAALRVDDRVVFKHLTLIDGSERTGTYSIQLGYGDLQRATSLFVVDAEKGIVIPIGAVVSMEA